MRLIVPILACVMFPSLSQAQIELPRNEVAVAIGWAGSEYRLQDYDRWRSNLFLSIGAGHYWTDHLKTDIEAGWNGPSKSENYDEFRSGDLQTYAISNYRVRDVRLAIGQSYQFGRNQWIHPYVGAGTDVIRRTTVHDRPAQTRPAYYQPNRGPQDVVVPAYHEQSTRVLVRPFIRTGVKMYASERAFLATELKVGFAPDLDHALWKLALGFDF